MRPSQLQPLDILSSRPIVRILRYLIAHPGAYTGRQLAAAAGVTHARAVEALETLARMGVVRRRHAGRSYLYELNEQSYLVSDVVGPAFRNEVNWLRRLGEEVLRTVGNDGESAVLYGSWARGTATDRSDVDLLVITRSKRTKQSTESRLVSVRARLIERFHRPISLLVLSRREFRARLRRGDRLLRTIAAEGKPLTGLTLAELVSG